MNQDSDQKRDLITLVSACLAALLVIGVMFYLML